MPSSRPTECPACGHERLRRRGREESLFSTSDSREQWVCGLCNYAWTPPARGAGNPSGAG